MHKITKDIPVRVLFLSVREKIKFEKYIALLTNGQKRFYTEWKTCIQLNVTLCNASTALLYCKVSMLDNFYLQCESSAWIQIPEKSA